MEDPRGQETLRAAVNDPSVTFAGALTAHFGFVRVLAGDGILRSAALWIGGYAGWKMAAAVSAGAANVMPERQPRRSRRSLPVRGVAVNSYVGEALNTRPVAA